MSRSAFGSVKANISMALERPENCVCIVTHSYFRPDGGELQVGGVQTYVEALRHLLAKDGMSVKVLQSATRPFRERCGEQLEVVGVAGGECEVRKAYQQGYRDWSSLTIFAYFNWGRWCSGEQCIAIQHGVACDGFWTRHSGLAAALHRLHRRYESWKERRETARILDLMRQVVCVDLNFGNWLRAVFPFRRWEEKLAYVPNFGDPINEDQMDAKLRRNSRAVSVLVPRRFEEFRGTLLMARVVKEIAREFPHCNFVFAGRGSQEGELRTLVADVPNCTVREIPSKEMPRTYSDCDVVVVPSLWSEGTSLSCIEGMCAGCAVLATSIGGLGNLILNEFNGLIVEPTYESLQKGLLRLLREETLREELARNGYLTARACFSRSRWEMQIRRVIGKCLAR